MVKLPFLNKSPDSEDKFLTVSINADYIQVLAFYKEEKTCKIIGSGSEKLEYGSVRSGVIIDQEDVSEALRIAIAKATKDLEQDIKKTIIGVSGDLCVGINTTSRFKRGKTDPLKPKEIDELYNKIVEAAYMQAQNDYMDTTGDTDEDLDIVTSSNVYTKIDGDFVEELVNQEGNIIETSVFSAFCPTYHIKTLQKISKNAGIDLVAIGSELYSVVQQLKSPQTNEIDYILIDLSRDTTNLAIIFSEGIVGTKSFNIGLTHLIDGIADKMGLTREAGEKVLQAHLEEKLTANESSIVHTCIIETVEIWLAGLEITFNEFKGVKTFPSKIFMLGQGTILPTILEMCQEEPWTKSIPFKEPPKIKKIEFTDLEKINDSTGVANTEKWLTQACLSIIYTEMFGESDDQN